MGTTLTFKTTKSTFFTEIVEKVVKFFSSLKNKTNNLSSTKTISIDDKVDRLHYILTSTYKLDDQNKILIALVNKTFDNRQEERRALEASLSSLKTQFSNNPNIASVS